jgi:hypothetical protein
MIKLPIFLSDRLTDDETSAIKQMNRNFAKIELSGLNENVLDIIAVIGTNVQELVCKNFTIDSEKNEVKIFDSLLTKLPQLKKISFESIFLFPIPTEDWIEKIELKAELKNLKKVVMSKSSSYVSQD